MRNLEKKKAKHGHSGGICSHHLLARQMFLLNANIHLPNTMASVQVDHIHHYNDYSQAPSVYFRQKASTASLVT